MKTLILLTILFASTAHAEHISSPNGRTWVERVRSAKDLTLTVLDANATQLSFHDRQRLAEIADEQAQAWADTILEGDYLAETKLEVERIEAAVSGTEFVGYRVTYSSQAYETSDCDAQKDISSCTPGKIVESTLVAPELDSWLRDSNGYAEFVPNGASQ